MGAKLQVGFAVSVGREVGTVDGGVGGGEEVAHFCFLEFVLKVEWVDGLGGLW